MDKRVDEVMADVHANGERFVSVDPVGSAQQSSTSITVSGTPWTDSGRTLADGTMISKNRNPDDNRLLVLTSPNQIPSIDGYSIQTVERLTSDVASFTYRPEIGDPEIAALRSAEMARIVGELHGINSTPLLADPVSVPVSPQETPSSDVIFGRSFGLSTLLGANATTSALYTPIHSEGAYRVARGVPGYQAHHLNQNAIYKNFGIPEPAGFSINIRGNALNEAGSPHYEAHASLEQWWNQYRRGGDKFGEVPTNGEVGEASRKSLVDAGLDPVEAQRVSDIARQQRINAGHAEAAPVPRIPGRVVQTPTSTVDETLWKTRRVATGLKWGGRALMAYGAAMDAASLYSEVQTSRRTGNYGNTVNETVRIAGGWSGAWAVGGAGAEFGAGFGLAFGPVGALVGGFAGGVVGGAIGYSMGSYAAQGIYADMRRW